jgi:hypothetical protein
MAYVSVSEFIFGIHTHTVFPTRENKIFKFIQLTQVEIDLQVKLLKNNEKENVFSVNKGGIL